MGDPKKTILVVDDDPKIRLLLRRCLEGDGYEILEAETEQQVLAALQDHELDLITLDLQLGPENGLHIAASVREVSRVPIIMVTGKGDVIDKVVGLEMGADDYISKPFHVREVQARVRSVIRRSDYNTGKTESTAVESSSKDADQIFTFEGWIANCDKFELIAPNGEACELTTTDFRLLILFLNSPKRVLSRDRIMDELSGHDWTPYDRTIDNQVARLRKKIEADPARPSIIKTVRGVGYIFAVNVEKT